MTTVLTLYNYPEAGTNDAELISVPQAYRGLVQVFDTTNADVTDYLLEHSILYYRRLDHGWIAATDATTTFKAKTDASTAFHASETYYAMSVNFNAGETPVFFARVENSRTGALLKTSDVESIALTIYQYSANNIRSASGTGYVPITGWDNVPLVVADVVDDTPEADPRVNFIPNVVFEPDTLEDNPFDNPGQYRAVFNITPVEGNRIPVVVDFRVR